MLQAIEISNFRAFKDPALIPFSPITLVLGTNSAGKSSLISSLLIMKQTIEDPSYGILVPILRLSGSRIEGGTYREVVHAHKLRQKIEFKFHFNNQKTLLGPSLVGLKIPRTSYTALPYYHRYPFYYDLSSKRLNCITLEYASAGQFSPNLTRFKVDQSNGRSAWFTRTAERKQNQHWRAFTHQLPKQSLVIDFSESPSLFPGIKSRRRKFSNNVDKKAVRAIIRESRASFHEASLFFRMMTHIGPFRTPPKRRYTFSGLAATETGQSGEQGIDLLILETITRSKGNRPLTEAVNFWLEHLNLAKNLEVTSIAAGSNLFEILISGAGNTYTANLADVGFGVSQILPVLIQGLLTPRGSLFAVQQPEIHLHPDAQAGLADFFLFLSSMGIRCLVETHSEYLLVRMRRRLAEGGLPIAIQKDANRIFGIKTTSRTHEPFDSNLRKLSRNDVTILLTQSMGAQAQVNKIVINDLFQLENLPDGFMTQALDDRIAITKAYKHTK